jgi:hypothetical protein
MAFWLLDVLYLNGLKEHQWARFILEKRSSWVAVEK